MIQSSQKPRQLDRNKKNVTRTISIHLSSQPTLREGEISTIRNKEVRSHNSDHNDPLDAPKPVAQKQRERDREGGREGGTEGEGEGGRQSDREGGEKGEGGKVIESERVGGGRERREGGRSRTHSECRIADPCC